jgi:sigma-B regulation protein RsbU (phosphoserine phosphatase)
MAMAMTLLHLEGDRLRLCNAGMPPVHHCHAAEGTMTAHRASGPPLGQLRRFAYAEASLTLAEGDALVLCSDGFPECMDPEDRMLGYEGMAALVLRHGLQAPEVALNSLSGEAHAWAKGRPLADDMSFLTLTRMPRSATT